MDGSDIFVLQLNKCPRASRDSSVLEWNIQNTMGKSGKMALKTV